MTTVSEVSVSARSFSIDIAQPDAPVPPIVLAVPGMRSIGEWISKAANEGRFWQSPVEVLSAHGDAIPEWELLFRWNLNRRAVTLRDELNNIIIKNPGRRISVLCHSLGCEVFRRAIGNMDYEFDQVIFIGSVMHRNHAREIKRSCRRFVNDKGSRDWWTVIANWICPLVFSSSGTFGFNKPFVIDRSFDNNHITCTSIKHMEMFVVPVLYGLQAEESKLVYGGIDFTTSRYLGYLVQILKFGVLLMVAVWAVRLLTRS